VKTILVVLIVILDIIFSSALANSLDEREGDLQDIVISSVAQNPQPIIDRYTGQYSGNNVVALCLSGQESAICESVKIPEKVGKVTEIVFGNFSQKYDASWLAFTNEAVSFCVAEGRYLSVRCKSVGLINYNGVDITFDRKRTGIPSLVFSSTKVRKNYIQRVANSFLNRVYAAANELELSSDAMPTSSKCIKGNCEISIQREVDVEIPIVEITAPFPDSPFDGGGFVIVPVIFGDPLQVPDPLPSGVAPSDILKARDPVGMAACTAGYYRTWGIMVQGCVGLKNANRTRMCFEKAMAAYWYNLENECYAKYY